MTYVFAGLAITMLILAFLLAQQKGENSIGTMMLGVSFLAFCVFASTAAILSAIHKLAASLRAAKGRSD